MGVMPKTLKIDNCLDCPFHAERPDPGADSFDMVDTKIVCTKSDNKIISGAERPWRHRPYTDVPEWCPLEDAQQTLKRPVTPMQAKVAGLLMTTPLSFHRSVEAEEGVIRLFLVSEMHGLAGKRFVIDARDIKLDK